MRKHIRNTLQALGLALVFATGTASAGVWVGGGVEYYTLGEYLDYYNGKVNTHADLGRESGYRPFVEASTDIPLTERLSFAVAGHAYGGSVDYGSRYFSPSINSKMDYTGLRAEAGLRYRPMPHGENSDLVFVSMLGYETWTRKLSATGEKEEWKMPLLRLGAEVEPTESNPWVARGGFLIPVRTTEHYSGGTVSGTYSPEPALSFYVGLGRRFTRFVEAGINYEALRFSHLDSSEKIYANPRLETDAYQFYLKVGI